jgi:ABC-type dipeptide/oligopeptide/nickel transport system permease subunit
MAGSIIVAAVALYLFGTCVMAYVAGREDLPSPNWAIALWPLLLTVIIALSPFLFFDWLRELGHKHAERR